MRVFACELKKLWSIKILLVIAAFGVITWFALLHDAVDGYESLKYHGAYGSYQTEMFTLYGETLEPKELANYNIPGKLSEADADADKIIAAEPVFAKYGITSLEGYHDWFTSEEYMGYFTDNMLDVTVEADVRIMNDALNESTPNMTLDDWYASPLMKRQCLLVLEQRYTKQDEHLDIYKNDTRPAVVRAAERLKDAGNNSLINEYLLTEFSLFAAVTGVFAVISVMVLVTPLLIIDRSRSINLLQYSSTTGRKIFKIQFAATAISALVLSLVITAVLFALFIIKSGEYWNTSIMSLGERGMWLYNITFGHWVLLLAGIIIAICIGAASLSFVLARFSSNIVNAMIKAVPVGVTLAVTAALSLNMAMSYNNMIFNELFRGKIDIPEVIFCGLLGIIGLIVAVVVASRENRVDVM